MNEVSLELVITRHPALVKYLKEKGFVSEGCRVYVHATPELVTGQHVWGVLPHSLSVLTKSYTEVPLRLTPELRGVELTLDQVRALAGTPRTYRVEYFNE